MSLPQLVALDLDGTLLNRAKQLTPRTTAAIRELEARGVICVLASGRMYHHCMEPYVTQLGLPHPVICYNGAVILDPSNGQILSEQAVPAALWAPVVEFAEATGRTYNLYLDDQLYCPRASRFTELYCGRTSARPVFREDLAGWAAGRDSTKLILLDDPAQVEELYRRWHAELGDQLYVTVSDPEYLEFMNRGANKGWALRELCRRLGVDPANTVAFGDARNDIPLLQAAGTSYAMADARPELQAVADHLAPSHDDDGVAQVMERWLAASGR
ncbi:MAG: HAD family phosphatase [Fimbriimonadaceae bacterium]|nr:HAD family phosphatase [Fimbriimonadaceae bacterium]